MRKLTLLLSAGLLLAATVQAQDTPVSDGVAITVYNQGSAMVQDRRTFTFEQGSNLLNFTDVAAQIDATSVTFKSLSDPDGTIVLEQNYVYDLVNSRALLQRYIDQTITVTTSEGTVFEGQLLSGGDDLILRNSGGEVLIVKASEVRDIRFPELPEGLITRPTLRWLIEAENGGAQQVELTYMTNGMGWTADYNLLLNDSQTALDLNGWVTLSNNSGAAYRDALLKLIAGDVSRLPSPEVYMEAVPAMPMAARAEDQVQQREFFEYKLYEIQRPVTIGSNETKQIEFVSGTNIVANTFYVYDASPGYFNYGYLMEDQYYGQTGVTNISSYLEFTTSEESGLDADLPAGRIRVFQQDVDGAALLIGENRIDHTPKGETIRVYLGNAFDLVGERTQKDFQLITGRVLQETYEIRLRNRKASETVEIRVPERLFRWSNWQILDSSHPYTQLDSSTIEYRVPVEPGAETVITYTVQYSWPR